jgi:hypothetical protein
MAKVDFRDHLRSRATGQATPPRVERVLRPVGVPVDRGL